MDLIVISSPTPVIEESIIINNLFKLGLKYFHLRKPGYSCEEIEILLNGVNPEFYGRIALHQLYEIANNYGINRLHYNEKQRRESATSNLQDQLADGFTLTTSVHDQSAFSELTHFDYAFFGPVFDSISKPGYQSKLPIDYKLDKTGLNTKVIALGGIKPSNLMSITQMGFDGAALLGAIWKEPINALDQFKLIKTLIG